jgi:hypothetical protein
MDPTCTDASFLVLCCLYILAGAISPILIEVIALEGAADPSTMLVLLPGFIGMGLSAFTNGKAHCMQEK